MRGIKIQVNDIYTGSHFDMTKLLVKIIAITKNLSLSDTELHALTFFIVNGYSKITREELISSKILKNKNSVSNLVHSFRKIGRAHV